MGTSGQNVFKGINAQALAATSLFLQCLREPNFSYIQLEAPQFEDFNLVFSNGRKIICESKDWKRSFNFADLKKVLQSILKKNVLGENDEILIICTALNETLKDRVHNMKYWSKLIAPELEKDFKKKKFTDKQISVLSKVRFWKVPPDLNEKLVYSLFSELINFWLPQKDIMQIVDNILMQRIYKGSAEGNIFTKDDIFSEIEKLKNETVKKSGYFDDERVKIEAQIQNLIKAIEDNKSPIWAPGQLSALSSKPGLMFFVLKKLEDKPISNIEQWKDMWQLYRVYRFSFSLFRIFENNLHTEKNKKYILRFIKNDIREIRRFYQHDFFDVDIVKITTKIIAEDKKFLNEAFEIVKKLIIDRRDDIFYLKIQREDLWEKQEIAKLLKNIYEKANPDLKHKIYKLITETFNLIKDDGNFSHYTPREIFEILRDWLDSDFERRLSLLTKALSGQYDQFYKKFGKKLEFQGWEYMGGMTSSTGHHYTVGDRHFIGFTLGPVIKEYYDESKNKAWNFILNSCISKTDKKTQNKVIKKSVSRNRPDFLNRAVLPIVFERYQNSDKKVSDEAFEILKEFILSRKGIPHKSDLIYQALRGRPQLSDDKKWKLVEVSMNKYGVPVSVFVEEIVSGLAKEGNPEAKKALKDWLKNPKYYEKFRFEMNIVQNIRTIFDSDFKHAVSLFEDFINSEYFINKQDSFESYEVAVLLYDILKKDHKRGLGIIDQISKQKNLTKNQQIILCFSLFNYRGNDQSDDVGLLEEVYKKFVNPFLNGLDNDINKIVKKLSFNQAREAFVQFAERLARNKKIEKALRIVNVFINDPDPYLPGKDPEDPENEYNEHQRIENGEEPHSITSTRGWCGWVLMKCSVLAGRDYVKDIIGLTKQLTEDKNWYAKHMACFALSQLTQNRLTVLPDNRKVLFFGKDKEEALKRAKRVEKIAFNLLADIAKAPDNVKKALAKSTLTAFDHIRILNEKDALVFVNTLKKFPDEAIAEAAPLFIFFAEFRKDAFKDWKWKTDKYYNDLGPDKYDDKKFKKILLEVMDKIEPKHRFSFAAQFEHLLRDLDCKQEDAERLFNVGYHYLDHLAEEYNHDLSNIIYMTIKNEMVKKHHFDKWHALYLKYLEKEKEFYKDNFKSEKSMEMYWWPSYYNEDILLLIHQKLGKDKFLEAFDIITQFPKELEIHASDKIISLLDGFPKTNKTVKAIVGRLFEKDPSKYYELRNSWLNL